MARSDAENLERLKNTRDALIDAIELHGGLTAIELSIRGRMRRYSNPMTTLDELNRAIDLLERRTAPTGRGAARNVARMTRGGR